MELEKGKIDFNEIVKGDTFDVSFDLEGFDISAGSLHMEVRTHAGGSLILSFATTDGSIVVTPDSVTPTQKATVRLIKSSAVMKTVATGSFVQDIEHRLAGVVTTLTKVGQFNVVKEVTVTL